jgi:hypothetical protein
MRTLKDGEHWHMNINEFAKEAHELAKSKGWWDKDKVKTDVECHMLMITEIAEATEEVRKGTPPNNITTEAAFDFPRNKKPEGELIELADLFIRLVDYTERKGWNLSSAVRLKHEYNKSRSYRHGDKKL